MSPQAVLLLADGGPLHLPTAEGGLTLDGHDAVRFGPDDPMELRLSAAIPARILFAEFEAWP